LPALQKMAAIASTVASLQANQAISVGPVINPHSPKVNGVHKAATPSKPHFLDTGFKDAEETLAQLLEEAKALRNKWNTSGRSASEMAAMTKQLRAILDKGKSSLTEVDSKVVNIYRSRVRGADLDEITLDGRKPPVTASSPAVKSEELKSSPKVPATTLKTPKPELSSADKTLVKSPPKKEAKITSNKEEPLEVDIKKEEVEEEKPKPTEGLEHRVIFATEGEAVIKDVEKLGENAPSKQEKEEEGIQDVSVDELEVEDSIMEQVNGDVSENEEGAKSNGDDLKESCVVSKVSKPFCDEGETGESLKRELRKESESEAISCIQEKES